ncbi:MAG: hypothetical protein AAB442_00545 [Patescibacteria group bacterium]
MRARDVRNLVPQVGNGTCCRFRGVGGFCIKKGRQRRYPLLGHRVFTKKRRELRIQQFASYRRFDAFNRLRFSRTAVVGIEVNIAVLLVFLFLLGGDAHTAGAAEQATIRARIILDIWYTTATMQDDIRLIKKLFRNERLVRAFVHFARVAEVSVVERILEKERNLRDMNATIAFRQNARLLKHRGENV